MHSVCLKATSLEWYIMRLRELVDRGPYRLHGLNRATAFAGSTGLGP
jgi:hypothetical protein